MDSIAVLLRIALAGAALTLQQAQRLCRFFIWVFVGAVAIVLVGLVCNTFGWRDINPVFSLVLTAFTVIVWFEPVRVAIVAITGAIIGALPKIPGTAASTLKKFLSIYADILGKFLLWGSISFFVLAHTSLEGKSLLLFDFLSVLLLLFLIKQQWKIGGVVGKRLFHAWVSAMAVYLLAMIFVPESMWAQYVPFELRTAGETTKTEEALERLKRTQREVEDRDRAKKIGRIIANIKLRKELTGAEKQLIAEAEEASGIGRIGKALGGGLSKEKDAASTPQAFAMTYAPQQSEYKGVLSVPAKGVSPPLWPKRGYELTVTGDGFDLYCFYRDKSIRKVEDLDNPATDGPILFYFVQDTTGKENLVSYEYVSRDSS